MAKRLAASEGREERADDEGSDLLLNSEGGAGGAVRGEQGGGSCR
jgi:hypothetical protein